MASRFGIIGGGIVGLSVAYHLSRETDAEIRVFERNTPASETTYKSVAMFGYYGDRTQFRMKRYGMRLYNRFFADAASNPKYRTNGMLVVSTDGTNARRFEALVDDGDGAELGKIGEGFGRDAVQYFSGDQLKARLMLPPVDTDSIAGAIYRPNVGYMVRPHELAFEFLHRATDNGVRIHEGTAIEAIVTRDGRVERIATTAGDSYDVDHVVCAAGPWNVEIAESVGVSIPVRHTLAPIVKLSPGGQSDYTMPAIKHFESPYSIHRRDEDEFLLGYNPGGYEHGTRFDPNAVDERVPADIRDGAFETVETIVPEFADAAVEDEWVGVRSVTPDGNPVVGWTELDGFSIAAFHTSGIQLAPAVGKVIASQLVDGDPTSFYDALSITRIDGYSDGRP